MQMEQSRGMQTSGRNFTKENRTQSAGEHLCSCGCGLEGATHHDKVLEKLLGSDEGHPVYFNVPGLQCEQTQYIKMSPHVPSYWYTMRRASSAMSLDCELFFSCPAGS